jgi:hypothetical protein
MVIAIESDPCIMRGQLSWSGGIPVQCGRSPSETRAARTQLRSGRFRTDDRDCAALTYLARQGAAGVEL